MGPGGGGGRKGSRGGGGSMGSGGGGGSGITGSGGGGGRKSSGGGGSGREEACQNRKYLELLCITLDLIQHDIFYNVYYSNTT